MVRLMYSLHWIRKRKFRKTISEFDIEYAIIHSPVLRDKRGEDILNAICKIPPSGRTLKVVYKRKGNIYKILTSYWLY